MIRNQTAKPAVPCYRVQLRNGVYQVFDACYYAVVGAFNSEKAANARRDELNARPRPARKGGRP